MPWTLPPRVASCSFGTSLRPFVSDSAPDLLSWDEEVDDSGTLPCRTGRPMNERGGASTLSETQPGSQAALVSGNPPTPPARRGSYRESVESFVVVFVAFLIWSMEAEGFVIPTGSMAPTLMGRHKEVTCPECGYVYTVNAHREVDTDRPDLGDGSAGPRWGTCQNCRNVRRPPSTMQPSFSGDRIYVMKDGACRSPFLSWAGRTGPASTVGRGRLQAPGEAGGPLHQATGRHAG